MSKEYKIMNTYIKCLHGFKLLNPKFKHVKNLVVVQSA